MPIRINLLAEAQSAEDARRRDPVKRAIWVAGIAILLMLMWGGFEFSKTMVVRSGFQDKEKQWKSMEALVKSVSDQDQRARDLAKQIGALDRLTTNRFLWAPVLNALQQTRVNEVQFIRVAGSQSYTVVEGKPPLKQGTRVIPGTPGTSTENISLLIEAKDYGNLLDENYKKLQNAIITVPFFKTNLGTANAIALKALVTQQTPDSKGRLFTTFTLELKFPERKREEEK